MYPMHVSFHHCNPKVYEMHRTIDFLNKIYSLDTLSIRIGAYHTHIGAGYISYTDTSLILKY